MPVRGGRPGEVRHDAGRNQDRGGVIRQMHKELAREWVQLVDELKKRNRFEYEDAENRQKAENERLKGRLERFERDKKGIAKRLAGL